MLGRVVETGLHIAVLGDLHGHFTLAYRLLRRWEHETEKTLDLILQVGDLGAFPPPFRLDKATKRFSEHDPDEMGFADYFAGSHEADEILGRDAPDARRIAADMVFIRGNHEDFEFLAERAREESMPSVDAYGRIRYLPNGGTFKFARGEHVVRIMGLGGISDDGGPGADGVSLFYTRADLRLLRAAREQVDILLTHEPPFDAAGSIHPRYSLSGSRDGRDLVRDLAPRFHFCGHIHEPGVRLPARHGTESWELNALNFHNAHRLNSGCIGILRWVGTEPAGFEILNAPWMKEFNRATFRHL